MQTRLRNATAYRLNLTHDEKIKLKKDADDSIKQVLVELSERQVRAQET